jgi:hypothetical protein
MACQKSFLVVDNTTGERHAHGGAEFAQEMQAAELEDGGHRRDVILPQAARFLAQNRGPASSAFLDSECYVILSVAVLQAPAPLMKTRGVGMTPLK